jgi:anthranilate synthase component 1
MSRSLPEPKPDPNGVPEAMLMRPGVVMIFDAVRQEIIIAAPERGGEAAQARIDTIERSSRPAHAAFSPERSAGRED